MIRPATVDDFEQILHIRSQIGLQREKLQDGKYRQKVETEGFLLYPTMSLEEYKKEIEDLFLVFEEESRVKGFIHIDDEHAIDKDSPVQWDSPEMRTLYYTSPHAYISGIAVDPAYAKQGIATQLLQEAIQQLSKDIRYLFSIVVVGPIKNIPSLLFHEKNDFKKIATIHHVRRAELDNYQSIVYTKKL